MVKITAKTQTFSRIDQFKERCIENEIQTYELSLGKIDERIREFNVEISYKIIQCNTQLEYDETDLDSDYENGEDETPTKSEDGEDSDETLSDNDSEKEERAMSPIPYPCCNEIHCICYDQIEIDKEYEEYCLNQTEQMFENH
ncbi:unnamed protein product [Rhizophagus irregularis]|uniref:Uncharacterized protein n=2 Tax=Rhizophagus irregularis TaxID=588596 RepID=A0A2I1HL99_9GLOM|nr:hypothetical protein RhiirA4_482596 [Rhizophagus irregularis]CAB4420315.1 unnamed protein product [Rhizophagus irregularis]